MDGGRDGWRQRWMKAVEVYFLWPLVGFYFSDDNNLVRRNTHIYWRLECVQLIDFSLCCLIWPPLMAAHIYASFLIYWPLKVSYITFTPVGWSSYVRFLGLTCLLERHESASPTSERESHICLINSSLGSQAGRGSLLRVQWQLQYLAPMYRLRTAGRSNTIYSCIYTGLSTH